MPRKTKPKLTDYEKLKKIWYKKLEKSGFVDVEAKETCLRTYRYSKDSDYGQYSAVWQDSKAQYYDMATQFLNNYEFSSNLEKVIWEYHTEGISTRDIAKTLNKVRVRKFNKDQIWAIINELRNKMKAMYLK